MRFTSEDAFEFRGTPDAIKLDPRTAVSLCVEHGTHLTDYRKDTGDADEMVDAGDLLAWLGY